MRVCVRVPDGVFGYVCVCLCVCVCVCARAHVNVSHARRVFGFYILPGTGHQRTEGQTKSYSWLDDCTKVKLATTKKEEKKEHNSPLLPSLINPSVMSGYRFRVESLCEHM